ncbi:putative cation exchanger [Smittium culicis]|uniref:Putative cation exchanger n=1 Tax=Smittium culicis TaxID=133412 RepID=A0A1R1YPF9_9FUNG|nr:putative cation exchanger [Smittium culicis]
MLFYKFFIIIPISLLSSTLSTSLFPPSQNFFSFPSQPLLPRFSNSSPKTSYTPAQYFRRSDKDNQLQCSGVSKTTQNKCIYVKQYCQDEGQAIFNYPVFIYCGNESLTHFKIFISVLFLISLFLWIGVTASDYFSPNLQTVAQLFSIPDSIAGVTLLALGNGAPDIFTTYSAIASDSASLALGELIGAALFVICIVSGLMIIICKSFLVPKSLVYREMSFLAFASLILSIINFKEHITFAIAIPMLSLYIIYVLFIVVSFFIGKKNALKLSALQNSNLSPNLPTNSQQQSSSLSDASISSDNNLKSSLVSYHLKKYPRSLLAAVEFKEFFDHLPNINPTIPSSNSLPHIPTHTPQNIELSNISPSLQSPPDNLSLNHPLSNSSQNLNLNNPIPPNLDIPKLSHLSSSPLNTNSKNLPLANISSPTNQSPTNISNSNVAIPQNSVSIVTSPDLISGHSTNTNTNSSQKIVAPPNLPNTEPNDHQPSKIISSKSHKSNIIIPTIYVSPPSIIESSEFDNPNFNYSLSQPNLTLSNSSIQPSESTAPQNTTWLFLATVIPTLKKWDKTSNFFTKIIIAYLALPVLLLSISIPVVLNLPYFHNSDLGLDDVWDVLSVVSQSIAQQTPGNASFDSNAHIASENDFELETHKFRPEFNSSSSVCSKSSSDSISSSDSLDSIEAVSKSLLKSKKSRGPTTSSEPPNNLSLHSKSQKKFSSTIPLSLNNRQSNSLIVNTNQLVNSSYLKSPSSTSHLSTASINNTSSPASNTRSSTCSFSSKVPPNITNIFNLIKCIACPVFISIALVATADVSFRAIFYGIGAGAFAAIVHVLKSNFEKKNPNNFLRSENTSSLHILVSKMMPILDILPTFAGLVSGLFWIYLISNEIVAIMQSLGAVFGISDGLLGLTVLALGNSVGDLATNLTVARLGYPIMGISACFGGPLLNILMGIGLSSVIKLTSFGSTQSIHVSPTKPVLISSLALFFTVVFLIGITILQRFRFTLITGYSLISIYVIVFVTNFVLEYK